MYTASGRRCNTLLADRLNLMPEDASIEIGDARIAIIGMAQMGTGAYDTLKTKYGNVLIGIDADRDLVDHHKSAGRNVIFADATDDDFWSRVRDNEVTVVLLTMSEYEQNLGIARRIRALDEATRTLGHTFAVTYRPEYVEGLKKAGVDAVWDFDVEAGTGFAEEVIAQLGDNLDSRAANATA